MSYGAGIVWRSHTPSGFVYSRRCRKENLISSFSFFSDSYQRSLLRPNKPRAGSGNGEEEEADSGVRFVTIFLFV